VAEEQKQLRFQAEAKRGWLRTGCAEKFHLAPAQNVSTDRFESQQFHLDPSQKCIKLYARRGLEEDFLK
jgi:hypothetical protein